MLHPAQPKKIFLGLCLQQKIFIPSLNFPQIIVLSRWVFRVPGMSDCRISKWVLHPVAEKNCRQNILFRGIMRWMPSLLFKNWENRSDRIFLFLRYERLMKTVCG